MQLPSASSASTRPSKYACQQPKTCSAEHTAASGSDARPFTSNRPAPYMLAALAAGMFAVFLDAAPARAAEPAGHIVVERDIPVHDGFQLNPTGHPTNVSTAREDIVIGSTQEIAKIAQPVSDATLGNIGGRPGAGNAGLNRINGIVETAAIIASGSAFSQAMGGPAMHSTSGIGSAVTNATSALGAMALELGGLK